MTVFSAVGVYQYFGGTADTSCSVRTLCPKISRSRIQSCPQREDILINNLKEIPGMRPEMKQPQRLSSSPPFSSVSLPVWLSLCIPTYVEYHNQCIKFLTRAANTLEWMNAILLQSSSWHVSAIRVASFRMVRTRTQLKLVHRNQYTGNKSYNFRLNSLLNSTV